MTSKFPLQFLKGNCDGCLQKKTIPCFLEFVIFLLSYEAAPKSMVLFFILELRPTGSRGFGCDRCRGQIKGAAKGEETGRMPTDL